MRKTLKILVVSLMLLWAWSMTSAFAQSGAGRPFITKWQGEAGQKLEIPIFGTEYKLVIKNQRGDVVKRVDKLTREDVKSPYVFVPKANGVYTVEAGPKGVKYMQTANESEYAIGEPNRLLEVVQFGSVVWTQMVRMFYGCAHMNFAAGIDTPDLSRVTSMEAMFYKCYSFNQPLEKWDMRNVTNMSQMFQSCTSFNQPLEKWDVSNVTNMTQMFYECSSFNQPLNAWKVDKVTDMVGMFSNCSTFNQPLDKWKVDKVTSMSDLFCGCRAFNQPLEKWDVSNVKDMYGMFQGCCSFNQPLNEWKMDKVTSMGDMFNGCHTFNQPLDKWKIRVNVGGLSTTAMSPSNYSQTLAGWAGQAEIKERIEFSSYNIEGLVYNDQGKAAREKLMSKKWTFDGDVYQPRGVAITPRIAPILFNKEVILPLEKWGVAEEEEVTLSTDTEGVISYEMTPDKKGIHVKPLKIGTCKLTATIAAKAGVHEGYTSTSEINVYIPVEHITLSPTNKTLKAGESFTFKANIFPENAVEKNVGWFIDSYRASIEQNGRVTTDEPGDFMIVIESNKYGCQLLRRGKLTVVDKIAPVASIQLPTSRTLQVGTTVQLIAVVKPDNAEQGLVWSSSDPNIATVSEGLVWGKKKGKCTITVKSLNRACRITKKCEISVEAPSSGGK